MKKGFGIILGLFLVGCITMAVLMGTGVIAEPQSSQAEENEVFYKPAVEEYITTYLGLSDAKFSIVNWKQWDDGAGFVMAENTYEINGVEHRYVARIGKDNMVYKLTIDGVELFSADADALFEYMEKYPVE